MTVCALKLTLWCGSGSCPSRQEHDRAPLQQASGLARGYLNEAITPSRRRVTDWIDFFREEWASAIYHDKFAEFVDTEAVLASDMGTYTILDNVTEALGLAQKTM